MRCEQPPPLLEVDGAAIVGIDRGSAPTARSPGTRRGRRARSAAAASPPGRSTTRRPRSRRRTTRAAPPPRDRRRPRRPSRAGDRSNAASGSSQLVASPASRAAFSAYACRRSRDAGHAPTIACQSRASKGPWPVVAASVSSDSTSPHRSGISASTASRARTSSPRFVSWVDSVVMAWGQAACRRPGRAWNSSTGSANTDGSAPDLGERAQPRRPVEGGVLDALRHHHAARLLEAEGGGMPRVGESGQHSVEHSREVGTVRADLGGRAGRGARVRRADRSGTPGSGRAAPTSASSVTASIGRAAGHG